MVSNRVCAVVVTYNRKNLLLQCLEALRKQTRPLEGMLIVDNASTDGTPEILLDSGYIGELPPTGISEAWEHEHEMKNLHDGNPLRVYYVRMPQNTGGAGGFHEGMKRAYEKGYDWIWVMDDDAEPASDALEWLLKPEFSHNDKVYALASIVIDPCGNIDFTCRRLFLSEKLAEYPLGPEYYERDLFETDTVSFVGMLVARKAIKEVGLPEKSFFIYYDDTEYSLRIKFIGGKIYTIPKSRIVHKSRQPTNPRKDPLSWRFYYGRRNMIYTYRKYGRSNARFYWRLLLMTLRTQIGILLFRKDKLKSTCVLWKSLFDGLRGQLGKTI